MISFPFDSEVSYDAQGLPVYDRPADSEVLRAVFARYFTTGIFYHPTTAFVVTAGTGLTVVVAPGAFNIEGVTGYEDALRTLQFEAADATHPRIDRIVLRLNLTTAVRATDLYIVRGTAAAVPVAPALTRDASIYELGLANVYIPANSTAISAERITDTRLDNAVCGLVAQTIGALDTTPYFTQVEAMIAHLEAVISGIEHGSEVMLRTVYDTNASGVVDDADKLGGQLPAYYGTAEDVEAAAQTAAAALPKAGGTLTGNVVGADVDSSYGLRNCAVYDSGFTTLQTTHSISFVRK